MLDSTITISYDAEGDGNPVDVILRRDQEYADRSVYKFPDSDGGDHTVTFYRVLPKQSGNFKGVARPRQKVTKPVQVEGVDGTTITSAMIGELALSIPKGASSADKIAFLQELLAIQTDADIRALHLVAYEI